MVYRAIGRDTVSRIGYASSIDGMSFTESNNPVLEPKLSDQTESLGYEDPRITQVGGSYFISYTAVSIQRPEDWTVRVALAKTDDFTTYDRIGIVIPEYQSKDAVLFPEKSERGYVMLHRVSPDIWIATSEDLINWRDHTPIIAPRAGMWDEKKIGAGAPPIRTPFGWLLIYHGVDNNSVYRLGIALLDSDDPRKVLYRSKDPIFEPQQEYEKTGDVGNVVFACGAIEKDDQYYIYYGAGDKSVCLATVPKIDIMDELQNALPETISEEACALENCFAN